MILEQEDLKKAQEITPDDKGENVQSLVICDSVHSSCTMSVVLSLDSIYILTLTHPLLHRMSYYWSATTRARTQNSEHTYMPNTNRQVF